MKCDIDGLMEERGLDALIVTGKVLGNPPLKYLVGGAGLTSGVIVKKRGEREVLIHGVMEREEAASTGFELMDFEAFGLMEIMREGKGPLETQKEFLRRVIGGLGIRGRVGMYGRVEVSRYYPLLDDLRKEVKEVEWVRDAEDGIFARARVTKAHEEVEAIRSVGERVAKVIQGLVDYLCSLERMDGALVRQDSGEVLLIRDLKRLITLSLAREGLLEEEETICSIGYDTAVPHNRGKGDDAVTSGRPIILDVFPADARTGYHYDVTRSMVIGEAPEGYEALYKDVKGACEVGERRLREGESASAVNAAVNDYFEAGGHPTLRTPGNLTDGYIHSLGHGIGLDVHEEPSLGLSAGVQDRLKKGMVFTIEPGLYYPDRSVGVRIEDVYWINDEGIGERLVDIPYVMRI
jgi:Xaa-Pro aminopeptidase